MKKFKFLLATLAIVLGTQISAQTTAKENPTEKTEITVQGKDSTGTDKQETAKDAKGKAKEYTTEMVEALNITDEEVIKTIQTLNENYEVSLSKSTKNSNLSEAELEGLKAKMDSARDNRLQGVLSPDQFKSYITWKKSKAETSK